jgi:hypothetical protein
MYTASCLCGGIQLSIHSDISEIFVCHCQQCQKAQGSAFVAITPIQREDLEIIQGKELFAEYYATANKKRVFCKQCASPLYSARLDLPDVVRLRVGIINEAVKAKIMSHAFTNHKAVWFEILDDSPQFAEAVC